MSSNTLPVCPKTGSTSPSLTVHLCLHTVPGNRECAQSRTLRRFVPYTIPGAQARLRAVTVDAGPAAVELTEAVPNRMELPEMAD